MTNKALINKDRALAQLLQEHFGYEDLYAYVRTFGCQGNVADSEIIKGILEEIGFNLTHDIKKADMILLNTCAIRENAQNRAFGNIGAIKKYKETNPKVITALCGCMPEQEYVIKKIKKSYTFLDLIFGTGVLKSLPTLLKRSLKGEKMVIETGNDALGLNEGLPVKRDSDFKAFLPILYGCDNFCSYCVVPNVRGRERSRPFNNILKEAENLVEAGYKEITLLGQNVNSYGLKDGFKENFAALLLALDQIQGDFWIRFMTSHPKDCSFELLEAMAQAPKVAKHLHLPFQSGNDRILQTMNRGYTRADYTRLLKYAKTLMPDLSVTGDVIVGFPGESEEEFEDTLSIVNEVEFTSLYTFIFSPREGTPAAEMLDETSEEAKSQRFNKLISLQEQIAALRSEKMVGNVYKVLCEGESPNKPGFFVGRTEGNIIIEFPGSADKIGSFLTARVIKAKTWRLEGQLI
ncbi:MAG: tRNA (N6-isopentenyl adenosine(37)-C2)-methylthiotransferase MiaB [Clostridiales bacterium]|nr:tRNA (N6-isopentenyl adenosine(37)-C2)-methylthiotransferase MiaB [Clostridiales bacterium]